MHKADDAAGLLESLVLLELADEFPQVGMERICINDTGVERLRRRSGEIHPDRIGERVAVSGCHFLDHRLRLDIREKAFAENMVKYVTVWIDRRDRGSDAPGFACDALCGSVESRFERGLPSAVIPSGQIREDEPHVVHLRDRDEQVRQSSRRHDPEVPVANGHRDSVCEIRRKFVEKKHERVAPQQLLPRYGSRRTK